MTSRFWQSVDPSPRNTGSQIVRPLKYDVTKLPTQKTSFEHILVFIETVHSDVDGEMIIWILEVLSAQSAYALGLCYRPMLLSSLGLYLMAGRLYPSIHPSFYGHDPLLWNVRPTFFLNNEQNRTEVYSE